MEKGKLMLQERGEEIARAATSVWEKGMGLRVPVRDWLGWEGTFGPVVRPGSGILLYRWGL